MSSKAAKGLILVQDSNILETPYEAAVAQLHNDVALAINKFMDLKNVQEVLPVGIKRQDLRTKLNKARSEFLGEVFDILVEAGRSQSKGI